jgi:hypothetical protein
MDIDKTKALEIVMAQEHTVLAMVTEIFLTKKFINSQSPVLRGENVVDQLTDYEKALFTAIEIITEKLRNGFIESLLDIVKNSLIKSFSRDDAKNLQTKLDVLNFLFHEMINARMGLNDKTYAIRNNWQVELQKEDDDADFFYYRHYDDDEECNGCPLCNMIQEV